MSTATRDLERELRERLRHTPWKRQEAFVGQSKEAVKGLLWEGFFVHKSPHGWRLYLMGVTETDKHAGIFQTQREAKTAALRYYDMGLRGTMDLEQVGKVMANGRGRDFAAVARDVYCLLPDRKPEPAPPTSESDLLKGLVAAARGILAGVAYGDHGNIKCGSYYCFGGTSPEIKALAVAVDAVDKFRKDKP